VSEERELLRETVAALVDKHASPAAVREAMASERGYDESLWKLLCEQVGVAALVVPEEMGGAGGELADAAVVLEELGKALVPTPLLGTTLAELALLASDAAANEPGLAALAKLRRDKAAKIFDGLLDGFNEPAPPGQKRAFGGGRFEALYQWSRRWMEAEQELATKEAGRRAAIEEHHKRMAKVVKLADALLGAGEVSANDKEAAEFYRLEAESWLKKSGKDR